MLFALLILLPGPAAAPLGRTLQTRILWQDPSNEAPCGGNYTGQAVEAARYAPAQDCASTWFVLVPVNEGGNVSSQLAFYGSHKGSFAGVIFDDFEYTTAVKGKGTTQVDSLSYPTYESLVSGGSSVCPVIYAGYREDPNLGRAPCVLLFFGLDFLGSSSESAYAAAMAKAVSRVNSSTVMVGIYGSAPRASSPGTSSASPTEGYVRGAESLGLPLVVWH